MNKNSLTYSKRDLTKKNSYANNICTGGEDNCARGCEGHDFSQYVVVESCVDSDVGPLFYQTDPYWLSKATAI